MDRINGLGTVDIGSGRRGFRDEDLAAGLEGTEVPASWLNAVQEEFMAVFAAAGITPSQADLSQLLRACRVLFPSGGVDFILSTRAFVVPANVYRLRKVCIWAGGSGGGGSMNQGSAGCGGGTGPYAEKRNIVVVPGQSILVTVGLGGAGGNNTTPGDGAAGGLTSFGSHFSVTAGEGGRGANGVVQSTPSAAGSAFSADFFIPGQPGATGYAISPTQCLGGIGGAPGFGSQSGLTINSQGRAGVFPGGGGGGGAYGGAGGNGGAGLCIVEW